MNRPYLLVISFLSVTTIALILGIAVKSYNRPDLYADTLSVTRSTVNTIKEPIYKYGL
jgi:hypothetical protein